MLMLTMGRGVGCGRDVRTSRVGGKVMESHPLFAGASTHSRAAEVLLRLDRGDGPIRGGE